MAGKVLTGSQLALLREAADKGLVKRLPTGTTICITGTLSVRRQDMESLIQAIGGRVVTDAKRARILILGKLPTSSTNATKKYRDAQQSPSCSIMPETDFVAMIAVRAK